MEPTHDPPLSQQDTRSLKPVKWLSHHGSGISVQECVRRWKAIFLPSMCPGCTKCPVSSGLCQGCQDTLHKASKDETELACYRYEGAIARLVQGAKFRPSVPHAMACLHLWSLEHMQGAQTTNSSLDAVTYIPSHWRRRVWRGFDLAELLAIRLGKLWNLPVIPLLKCTHLKKPMSQTQSRQERSETVKHRFAIRPLPNNAPHGVYLVDDVMTTGLTLKEGTRLLVQLDLEVQPMVFAKTPNRSGP